MDEPETTASFKLLVNPDPNNDQLILYVRYRDVFLRLQWRDGERQDVRDLLAAGDPTWFIDRGHTEYEVHRSSSEIDGDLGRLFPEVDEEVEDGE